MHEYRKVIYKDNWIINSTNTLDKNKTISFPECFKAINERLNVIKNWKTPEQTEESCLFNEIADVADDDYALTNL